MPKIGVWTGWAAPATVDWCEPNYVQTELVAEWYNCLSSLSIAALGVVSLVWSLRSPLRETSRFWVAAAVLTIVGFGSAAFHGTLLRVGQAMDELPMVYCGLAYIYIVLARKSGVSPEPSLQRLTAWRTGLIAFALAFTAAYLFFDRWFVFFVAAYATLVAALVVRTGWISSRASPTHRRLFLLSAGSYVGGVVLLWIPEHVLLPCDHPLQAFHLHAWFHLTSAIGSYAWLLWAAHDRASILPAARTMN